MSKSQHFQGQLYQQMSDDLHLAGVSQRTHDGYLRAVRQLADFCETSPDEISEAQMRKFFLHLKNERKFAYGSMRVAYSGVKFFYTRTCQRDWETLATMKLQNVQTLPEVITVEQVHQVLAACRVPRIATYFWTVYSLGLRLEEGLGLQVGDIDSGRMMVHVHRGKGAKDRYLPLPSSTLWALREHWATHRHPRFLFPADGRSHQGSSTASRPMPPSTAQKAMKDIVTKLGFQKKVSVHTLRHSYASHLLEAGASLKMIQQLLGHSSLQTTMLYLHLTATAEEDARKIIEQLFQWPRQQDPSKQDSSKPNRSKPNGSKQDDRKKRDDESR